MTEEKNNKEKKEVSEKDTKKIKKKQEPVAREVVIANGYSQRISKKYSVAICKMIKGLEIDAAITDLEKVVKKKKAVPMHALEVAHKPGNMAGGKYPVKAAITFIDLLKNLKANATAGLIERPIVTIAMANKAQRPFRRGGTRGKRTHIHLEARARTSIPKKNKKIKINKKNTK